MSYSPSNPRVVSDILDLAGPVAFERVDSVPYQYMIVCPFCATDLGEVHAETVGILYRKGVKITEEHVMNSPCGDAAIEFSVCLPGGGLGNLEGFY